MMELNARMEDGKNQHFLSASYLQGTLNTPQSVLILNAIPYIRYCYAHFIEGQLKFKNYKYTDKQRYKLFWINVSFQSLYGFCCIYDGLEENLMANSEMKVESKLNLGMVKKRDGFGASKV